MADGSNFWLLLCQVSAAEWLEARKQLLKHEKHATRLLDSIVEQRRQLPWTKVESNYVFKSTTGSDVKLSDLFAPGKNDLIVYHLMFAPEE